MKHCGAKTRAGGTCQKPGMANGRCRLHGGLSTGPKIMTAGGRYSKVIPKQLAAKYEEALADAELISVRDEAALVQSFIADAVEAVNLENCQAFWQSAQVLASKVRTAEKDQKDYAVHQLCTLIDEGAEEWKQIMNVLGFIEVKRKLAETEAKRMKDLGAMLNAKEANALIGALLGIINKQVPDHDVRSRIASDLAALVHTAA